MSRNLSAGILCDTGKPPHLIAAVNGNELNLKSPLFLVGFMCSGKTTLGQSLARCLDAPYIDLDEAIEQRQGRTISRIFAESGEEEFRRVEHSVLNALIAETAGSFAVFALGGGTPCRPGTMEKLNDAGITVHLDTNIPRFVERLLLGADRRPLVAGKNEEEITRLVTEMLAERNPYYRKARHTFDSSLLEDEEQINASTQRFINTIVRNP